MLDSKLNFSAKEKKITYGIQVTIMLLHGCEFFNILSMLHIP